MLVASRNIELEELANFENSNPQIMEIAKPLATEIERELGLSFDNKLLLIQAFIHPAYSQNFAGFEHINYERLEQVGDAVLDLIIRDYLLRNYRLTVGKMAAIRDRVVSEQNLLKVSDRLKLSRWLIRPPGSMKQSVSAKRRSDLIESLLAALYYDQGSEAAQAFVYKHIVPTITIPVAEVKPKVDDPRGELEKLVENSEGLKVTFRLLDSSAGFRPIHTAGAFIVDEEIGRGVGSSQKSSITAASIDALNNYRRERSKNN